MGDYVGTVIMLLLNLKSQMELQTRLLYSLQSDTANSMPTAPVVHCSCFYLISVLTTFQNIVTPMDFEFGVDNLDTC